MDNNQMLEYFLAQPGQLNLLLNESKERTAPFIEYWQSRRPDRLYLIGSGTSYHALRTVNRWMEAFLGVEVTVASPTSLPVIRGAQPALILVSQSGASTNTLIAAEKLRGHELMALTGETESPLHDLIDIHLDLGIGKETAGPKTIGYTASVLYLQLSALFAGRLCGMLERKRFAQIYEAFSQAVAAVGENLARTEAWYSRNENQLVSADKYVVVGGGTAAAVAGEGALKILETVKVPAAGYEFEEFLHGPILQIDNGLAGIYFLNADEDQPRIEALANLHASEAPYVYKVYGSNEAEGKDARDLPLKLTGEDYTQGIELIYPCQLIGARLPQKRDSRVSRNFFKEYTAIHRIKAYN
jgi:glucoselysine-6-phosphate deglycase